MVGPGVDILNQNDRTVLENVQYYRPILVRDARYVLRRILVGILNNKEDQIYLFYRNNSFFKNLSICLNFTVYHH